MSKEELNITFSEEENKPLIIEEDAINDNKETILNVNNNDSEVKKNNDNDNILENDEVINENNENEENEPLVKSSVSPKKPTSKKRLYWVDCLRVFSSFLVVFIHCSNISLKIPIDYKKYNGRVLIVYCCIARPCVPLFLMISGIFFLNPDKKISIKMIYTKYILRILKSIIFWSLYYNIIDYYVVRNKKFEYSKETIITLMKNIFVGGGHLWYLYLTIGLYILTPIYRLVVTDRKIAWYATIIYSIVTQFLITLFDFFTIGLNWDVKFLYDTLENLLIYKFGHYLCYYLLGYLVSTQEFTKKRYIYLSYFIGILGSCLSVAFRFISCYHYHKDVHKLSKYHHFNVAMGAYGIFVFFKYTVNHAIEPLMEKEWCRKVLSVFSECSFGVYLLHYSIYPLFCRMNFHSQIFDPLYWVPIYSVILYTTTFICVYLLRKINFFKTVM